MAVAAGVFIVAFLFAGALPLLPLLFKRLARHPHRGVNRIGRVFAFVTLWCAFNVSFATIWGALVIRNLPEAGRVYFLLWIFLFQIPALAAVSRVMRDDGP